MSISNHKTLHLLVDPKQAYNRHYLEEGDLDKDNLFVSTIDTLHVV